MAPLPWASSTVSTLPPAWAPAARVSRGPVRPRRRAGWKQERVRPGGENLQPRIAIGVAASRGGIEPLQGLPQAVPPPRPPAPQIVHVAQEGGRPRRERGRRPGVRRDPGDGFDAGIGQELPGR